jgi:hypothetical protein
MLHPFREAKVCLPVRVPCGLPLILGPSWRPCAAHSEGPVPLGLAQRVMLERCGISRTAASTRARLDRLTSTGLSRSEARGSSRTIGTSGMLGQCLIE